MLAHGRLLERNLARAVIEDHGQVLLGLHLTLLAWDAELASGLLFWALQAPARA